MHKKKSPRIYTSMHSGGFEPAKLTYTRLEDNPIRHRGGRSRYINPSSSHPQKATAVHFFPPIDMQHPTPRGSEHRMRTVCVLSRLSGISTRLSPAQPVSSPSVAMPLPRETKALSVVTSYHIYETGITFCETSKATCGHARVHANRDEHEEGEYAYMHASTERTRVLYLPEEGRKKIWQQGREQKQKTQTKRYKKKNANKVPGIYVCIVSVLVLIVFMFFFFSRLGI